MIGAGLRRPECVLATAAGTLYTSDKRGVMQIAADGTQCLSGTRRRRRSGLLIGRVRRPLDRARLAE